MSRRRIKPRQPRGQEQAPLPPIEERGGEEFHVRKITGAASTKPYICPGCEQTIRPATPHVVVWPVIKALLSEAAIDERRHWHTQCWGRKK